MAKSVDFWVHFRSTSSIFGLLVLKENLKAFPLIAKHIKKKEKKSRSYITKLFQKNNK